MNRRSISRLGVVAALAGSAIAGYVVQQVGAVGPSVPSAFVAIAPCRLVDTRPLPDLVGTRTIPIGPAETVTFQVRGANGGCTIPATATAIATNTTAVNPTAPSFLTVFPQDAPRPMASNLNYSSTSPPTPNQVTVGLSATGSISVFNLAGTVNVIIDIVGYFQPEGSGPVGPVGPVGPIGPRGISSFDTLPALQTVTGEVDWRFNATAASQFNRFSVDFPARGTKDLVSTDVEFGANAATDDANAACTGTFAVPTAPAGFVCIYIGTATNANSAFGNGNQSQKRSGFSIDWLATAAGNTEILASWAYTAPLVLILLPVQPADSPVPGDVEVRP